MTVPRLFPSVVIVLQLAATTVYALSRDTRHAMFWLACAVANAAVTF